MNITRRQQMFRLTIAALLAVSGAVAAHPSLPAHAAVAGVNGKIAFTSTRTGTNQVFVTNPDGSGQTNLSNNTSFDSQPAWSPDGSRIAYQRQGGGIWVMNANGTSPTQVPNTAGGEFPTWSRDGTKLAFDANLDGALEIYAINVAGTGLTKLTTQPSNMQPTWSPDGTKIAFTSSRNSGAEVWVMNADGTSQTLLVSIGNGNGTTPTWSPDGTKIAYSGGNHILVTSSTTGGAGSPVTSGTFTDTHPSWSPDGTKIAFSTNRGSPVNIYAVNVDGTGLTALSNPVTGTDTDPSWGVSAYAADWPGYGFDAAHSGANPYETAISPGNVSKLALAWSAPIGIDLRCTPVEANGVVYDTVGNGGNTPMTAYAYDLASGRLKWKTNYQSATTTASACVGGPSFGGGLLYVTDYYGFLGALDASTGAMKWSTQLGFGIWGAPTYSNGVLYVADRRAMVTALDAPTGVIKWQTAQFGNGAEVDSSPAVAGGLVVIGQVGSCFNCGGVWAFNQTNGAQVWHAGGTGHSSVRFESPAIAGGVVYVSIEDGGLDALDLTTGQRLWTGTIANVSGAQNWSTPAVSDGRVFVAANDGKLYAFGVGCGTGGASCSPIWTGLVNGNVFTSMRGVFASPAVANGLVYIVGDDSNQLAHVNAFAVNCASGGGACSPLWSASLNYDTQTLSSNASSAIVVNGTVLVNGYSNPWTPGLLAYRLPLDHLGLSPAASSITAGGSQAYTVTGYDAGGSSLGDMTSGTTFTISPDGSCTGATCTATIAGAHTVTGTNSGKTGTATLTVNAAAATQLALSGLTSAAAGTAQTATVTLRDSYGNVAAGYRGTVHFTSSDAQAALPADYTFVAGDAGTHAFPVTLKTAGSQSVTATDTSTASLTGSQTVTVTAAAASRLVLSGLVNAKSGTAQTAKVNLFDSFGNPATGYRGTVHFTSSDSQATLPADYAFTASDAGAHAFTLTLKTPGSQSVTATDTANSSITGSQTVTITPAVDLDLRLSVDPSTATTGTTVTASASLTNTSAVTRSVTLTATFKYVSAYGTFTFSSSTVSVTLAGGQTLAQSFPFTVDQNTPRGNYTVTVTATDVSGTASATASLVVV